MDDVLSTYTEYILNTGHACGNTQDKMEIIQTARKCSQE
jgi:hypothetical protein